MYMSVKMPSLTTYAINTDNKVTAVKAACCVQQSEIMSDRLWRHKFSSQFFTHTHTHTCTHKHAHTHRILWKSTFQMFLK